MKPIHITIINVFIIIFVHIFILDFLDKNHTSGPHGHGIPSVVVAFIPLVFNFIWSCATIYLASKSAEKQYFNDTLLYVILASIGHSLIAYFAEIYLWLVLIIPYLIFLGESFYLKFIATKID